MRRFKGGCADFSFKKYLIYAHDGASAKFSTNSHETDYSAVEQLQGPQEQRSMKKVMVETEISTTALFKL
jgi:hypothetical protein